MRTINFYDYVSKRYATNDTRENRVRELVYAFKSGQRAAVDHAVKVVSDLLINMCDHVIVTDTKYYSYAEEGRL